MGPQTQLLCPLVFVIVRRVGDIFAKDGCVF